MKIVIDIQDDVYRVLKEDIYPIPDIERLAIVFKVLVKKGTPLPKGHGRLIDADDYLANTPIRKSADEVWIKETYVYDTIMDAPTVIEANKEDDINVKTNNNSTRTT